MASCLGNLRCAPNTQQKKNSGTTRLPRRDLGRQGKGKGYLNQSQCDSYDLVNLLSFWLWALANPISEGGHERRGGGIGTRGRETLPQRLFDILCWRAGAAAPEPDVPRLQVQCLPVPVCESQTHFKLSLTRFIDSLSSPSLALGSQSLRLRLSDGRSDH